MFNNMTPIGSRLMAISAKGALVISVLFIMLCSCNNGEKAPDVSNIKVSLQTYRLDQDFAQIDTNQIGVALQQLHQKYPDFLNFYLDTLMGFKIAGNYADSAAAIQQGLKPFLTYKDYRGLFDTVAKHFPNTKSIESDLTKGFQYMEYYYPHYQVPKIIYLVSGLENWGAFTYETTTVGIGLDMFLGENYPYYRSVGIPDYMDSHMRPAYIPVAVFTTVYEDAHPLQMDERDLLDMIIQRGKEQYFLHKILPNTADSTMFGFSQAQVDWCKGNEQEMYNFFISNNLFYSKDRQQVVRYINDGPFATGMPSQSPGNVGSWVGLEIVKAYMKQHPQTTMQQLLELNTDAQLFLEQSKYKPKQ